MIRLTRRCYIKPGLCPTCHKPRIFVEHPDAVHCEECRRKIHRKANKMKFHERTGDKRNGYKWQKKRAKCVSIGYCQLCGTTHNLTAHHVGGGSDLPMTCLCSDCHDNYERYNNMKRAGVWR